MWLNEVQGSRKGQFNPTTNKITIIQNQYQHTSTDKTLTLQTLKHEVLIIVCMCVDSVDIT